MTNPTPELQHQPGSYEDVRARVDAVVGETRIPEVLDKIADAKTSLSAIINSVLDADIPRTNLDPVYHGLFLARRALEGAIDDINGGLRDAEGPQPKELLS